MTATHANTFYGLSNTLEFDHPYGVVEDRNILNSLENAFEQARPVDIAPDIHIAFADFEKRFRATIDQDILPTHTTFPIVSSRLKDVLQTYWPDLVQFFPAHMWNRGLEFTDQRYFAINFLKSFPLIDFQKSEFTTYQADLKPEWTIIESIKNIILIEDLKSTPDLFRLPGEIGNLSCPNWWLVSNKVVEVLSAHQIRFEAVDIRDRVSLF